MGTRSRMRDCLAACGALTLLALAPGCEHESASCPAECRSGIEGYVMGGHGPVQVLVQAERVDGSNSTLQAYAFTDSTGHYAFPTPSGRFVVTASMGEYGPVVYHSADGISFDGSRTDTIVVGNGPVRVDFTGGGLALEFGVPEAVGRWVDYCVVQSPPGRGDEVCGSATVSDGGAIGRASFLPPGTYRGCLRPSEELFWLPHGDIGSADSVVVTPGHDTVYSGTLPEPSRILGSVVGSWQALGVHPPAVAAYRAEDDRLGDDSVDEAGGFALAIFASGPVRLRVDTSSGPDRWVGGDDFAHATIFDLDSGQTITGVSIVESGILCTVQAPEGLVIGNLSASLWNSEGTQIWRRWFDSGEPVSICNLAPGAYRLQIRPLYDSQHWFPQFYDGADSLSGATPIVIASEGVVVPLTVSLAPSGGISGRVLTGAGAPAQRASVLLAPADDYTAVRLADRTGRPSEPGVFTIPHLHTGDYRIGARTGSAPVTWYPGTAEWDSAGVIHVVEGSEVTGVEWRMIE
jgi:hypothetical protein